MASSVPFSTASTVPSSVVSSTASFSFSAGLTASFSCRTWKPVPALVTVPQSHQRSTTTLKLQKVGNAGFPHLNHLHLHNSDTTLYKSVPELRNDSSKSFKDLSKYRVPYIDQKPVHSGFQNLFVVSYNTKCTPPVRLRPRIAEGRHNICRGERYLQVATSGGSPRHRHYIFRLHPVFGEENHGVRKGNQAHRLGYLDASAHNVGVQGIPNQVNSTSW